MNSSVTGTGSAIINAKNKSVQGVLVGITASAAITTAMLRATTIKASVNSGVRKISTPITGNLLAIGRASKIDAISNADGDGSGGYSAGFWIPFYGNKSVINLGLEETMTVEINVSGSVSGQVTYISLVEGVGVETHEGQIEVVTINSTLANQQISFGNCVTRLCVVSSDATNPVTDINISSDKFSANYNIGSIWALIGSQWGRTPADNSYCVFESEIGADGFTVNITNNGSFSAYGWLVCWKGQYNAEIAAEAAKKFKKHDAINAVKFNEA